MDDEVGIDPPGEMGTVDGPDVGAETHDGEDSGSVASDAEDPPFVYQHDIEEEATIPPPPVAQAPATAHTSGFDDLDQTLWNTARVDPGPLSPMPGGEKSGKRITARRNRVDGLGTNPLDLLHVFLPPTILSRVCDRTSRRLRARGHEALTLPEFYDWLALLLSMAIRKLPSTKHYWATTSFGGFGFWLTTFVTLI